MPRYGGPRSGDWTDAELTFLAEAPALGLTMLQVAERLGRPHGAVKMQAHHSGIRFPRRAWGGFQRPWSPEEDALIAELAPTTPYRDIAELIGRGVSSVNTRAYQLGVRGRSKLDRAPRGADAHLWRGGDNGRWRGEDWQEFRVLALERDGYICQAQGCGFYAPSGKGLVVHHMIPWRLRPVNELRWLVTLCGPDHMRRPEHRWVSIPEDVEAQLGAP